MAVIQWTNDLSVGVEKIDRQHQKLIETINKLETAMAQEKEKEVLFGVIQELIAYAKLHFKTEEQYFEQFGYEDGIVHKTQHVSFVKKISEFCEDYLSGRVGLSVSIKKFLADWVVDHIKGSDQKYTECFNRNGLY
ncbi:MAG: hemerythrin family protein [Pontiellaceae bacterium]|nr:hemerythrin family protein [Pontiellaceae bacterium]